MANKNRLKSNSINNEALNQLKDDINKKVRYSCLYCNDEEMNSLLSKYSILIDISKSIEEVLRLQDNFNKERIKVLKKIETNFRNDNAIPIDFKYNLDYNEPYKIFSKSLQKMLNEYTTILTKKYNILNDRINLIIDSYRSNAEFNDLYSKILKLKEQTLNGFNKGNERVETLLNFFTEQILELFAVNTSTYIKYHNLLLRSQIFKQDGKLKTKMDKLRNYLKMDNFNECYEDALEYIKQLEGGKKLTTIENIYQYILRTAMSIMSELSLSKDIELITKINYQLIEINRLLYAGFKGIIDIEDIVLLFNIKFSFSQEDINIINYLEDSANTIKSSNIFLNPKTNESPFYYLYYFDKEISLVNCDTPMKKIDYTVNENNYKTLDDLFEKGFLVGEYAYFFNNYKKDYGIVLLKYKNMYLVYSLDNNEYYWSEKVIYSSGKEKENMLLKAVNNNIDKLKQQIINYVNDCKNNHVKEYFDYLIPLTNN